MSLNEDLRKEYNPDGSELRNIQLKVLHILVVVTDICDRHGLQYWLSAGTLLGAVRHGGFIPWDDDIDIELLLPDYKKLLKILSKELPADMYLQTPREKGYRLLFSKVRDRYSIVDAEEENMSAYTEKGLFIDIVPEERGYKWMKSFVDFFYGRAFRRLKRGRPFYSPRYLFEYTVSLFLYPIGFIGKYIARTICTITKPNNILHGYGIGGITNHRAEDMFPTSKIKFEGHEFSSPRNIDLYLKDQYGDYMSIPPKEKRAIHFSRVRYINK